MFDNSFVRLSCDPTVHPTSSRSKRSMASGRNQTNSSKLANFIIRNFQSRGTEVLPVAATIQNDDVQHCPAFSNHEWLQVVGQTCPNHIGNPRRETARAAVSTYRSMSETLERDVLFRKLRARPENKVRSAMLMLGVVRGTTCSTVSDCLIGSAVSPTHSACTCHCICMNHLQCSAQLVRTPCRVPTYLNQHLLPKRMFTQVHCRFALTVLPRTLLGHQCHMESSYV